MQSLIRTLTPVKAMLIKKGLLIRIVNFEEHTLAK